MSSDDFYRHDHKLIFAAAQGLIERNQPCDAVTLSGLLETQGLIDQVGGLSYLGTLARDTPTAANIKAYADIVRERSVLRQLITVGNGIVDERARARGTRDARDRRRRRAGGVRNRRTRFARQGGFSVGEVHLAGRGHRIDELYNSHGMLTGIATGFKQLDRDDFRPAAG